MSKTLQHGGYITSIPLTITCALNGAKTDGVLVAVMQDDLDKITDALAAAEARVKVLERFELEVREISLEGSVEMSIHISNALYHLEDALAALDGQQDGGE